MPTDAQPWIDALHSSHERLVALVADLDADAVREPSYAEKWTIADVLSHLGSGAEIDALRVRAAVEHRDNPGLEVNQPIWDRWNAKSPDEQAADVIGADAASLATIDAVSGDQRRAAHLTFGPLELDFAGVVGLRLGEHALHTWDIAVALDPAAVVSADAVALIAEHTLLRTAGWAAKPTGRTFALNLRTHEGREFALRLEAESAGVSTGSAPGAAGTLALSDEQLVRLVYGRLDEAPGARLDAAGVTLDDVRAAFPGF
jgi:uncharacterized protein (TIGR03083 family)